jgi:DNA sulfur modification protein DndD
VQLASLTLESFGTYAGTQRIELTAEPDRPIVLVGGTNGAGKTTVLEALLLCLHGRRALGAAVSAAEYERYLASRIHVPGNGRDPVDEAAVEVAFEHTDATATSDYVVRRAFKRGRSGRVREQLTLWRDGAVVDDLPTGAWQDFLDGIVPPGVAGLFFFDGEKIQELAEDENGEQLADAVRRLVGLDLIEQLRVDLTRYSGTAVSRSSSELARHVKSAEKEVRGAQRHLRDLEAQKQQLVVRRERAVNRSGRARDKFAQEGGLLAEERERLEAKQRRAAERAAVARTELSELIAGLLPFALAPAMAEKVRTRLEREREVEEDQVVLRRLEAARRRIARSLASKREGRSPVELLEELLTSAGSAAVDRVHDVTDQERGQISEDVRRATEDVPPKARSAAKRLARAEEEGARLRSQLDRIPDASAVSGLLTKLQKIERDVGALDAQLAELEDSLQQARYAQTVADRELRRARERLDSSETGTRRAQLAVRTVSLLEEYEARLQGRKLEKLELEAARYFNRLSRKGELLGAIKIERDTFQVSLRRWDGTDLPKERLSAGERQLFAIAVLWALAQISGRPLPVVIDTPLARLDREHRRRLLQEYFPRVSHQVVVLSTDTEVDAAAAAELKPFMARSYHLDHDAETCSTSVEEGYFHPFEGVADAR